MTVYKKCSCCGKLHDITQLSNTQTQDHLTLFNCPCKSTLSAQTALIVDVLLNNAWANKGYDLKHYVVRDSI